MKQAFLNADILYWPEVQFDTNSVEFVNAHETRPHIAFQDACWEVFLSLCSVFNSRAGLAVFQTVKQPLSQIIGNIRGVRNLFLKTVEREKRSAFESMLVQMEAVLAAMDVAQVISISEAFNRLQKSISHDLLKIYEQRMMLQDLIDENPSPKFVQLMESFKKFDFMREDAGRVLVFVQTRDAANLLKTKLFNQVRTRGFTETYCSVDRVIGQNGTDGMKWKGQQQHTISNFKSGETDILIATSVLEEGIDVGECELVIRFDPPNSLIQHIQSRGRARKSGKMVIICNQADSAKIMDLTSRETILQHVLREDVNKQKLITPIAQQNRNAAIISFVQNQIDLLNPDALAISSMEV
jgi:ERCC4-related helicase